MNILTNIVSALVEAWGEVKVAKARVILSLVGVVAAVAALSTVIALGDLTVQANKEMVEAAEGRSYTLHISAQSTQNTDSNAGASESAAAATGTTAGFLDDRGLPPNPVGDAMVTVADRFKIPYWARYEPGSLQIEELKQIAQTGTFRSNAAIKSEWEEFDQAVQIKAVDPTYATLFRLETSAGRWIQADDVDMRVVPVVINSKMWGFLGRSPIEDPILLHAADAAVTFRVVGVVESKSQWESPEFYVDYTAWQYAKSAASLVASTSEIPMTSNYPSSAELLVWVGPDQIEQAREALPRALAAVLGEGWTASVYGGDTWDGGASDFTMIRNIIMVIGGIIIFLGALGLLNVAIVTVRQRIREIGIRRAMGASAKRVFFAVFMESVVATFVAGVIGVGIAIVIVRSLPMETLGLYMQERPGFPMGAAIDGIAISTAIGALCGIIPAFAAVKVKPIDAIRY